MTKQEYISYLVDKIEKGELQSGSKKSSYENIYIISGKDLDGKYHYIRIWGEFESGYRSVDHYALKDDNIEWIQILKYGTVLVPETMQQIGSKHDVYSRKLSVSKNNHIMGYSY